VVPGDSTGSEAQITRRWPSSVSQMMFRDHHKPSKLITHPGPSAAETLRSARVSCRSKELVLLSILVPYRAGGALGLLAGRAGPTSGRPSMFFAGGAPLVPGNFGVRPALAHGGWSSAAEFGCPVSGCGPHTCRSTLPGAALLVVRLVFGFSTPRFPRSQKPNNILNNTIRRVTPSVHNHQTHVSRLGGPADLGPSWNRVFRYGGQKPTALAAPSGRWWPAWSDHAPLWRAYVRSRGPSIVVGMPPGPTRLCAPQCP